MWWSIPVTIGILVFWIAVPLIMEHIANKKEKEQDEEKKEEDKNDK